MELGLRVYVSKFGIRYIPEHCKPSELSIDLKKKLNTTALETQS